MVNEYHAHGPVFDECLFDAEDFGIFEDDGDILTMTALDDGDYPDEDDVDEGDDGEEYEGEEEFDEEEEEEEEGEEEEFI